MTQCQPLKPIQIKTLRSCAPNISIEREIGFFEFWGRFCWNTGYIKYSIDHKLNGWRNDFLLFFPKKAKIAKSYLNSLQDFIWYKNYLCGTKAL